MSWQDVLIDKRSRHYRGAWSMESLVKMAKQAADGVRHLHAMDVIHRDLACRNLLLDQDFNVYVSDFGFARQKQEAGEGGKVSDY